MKNFSMIIAALLVVTIVGISAISFLLAEKQRYAPEDFPVEYRSGPLPEDKLLAWNEPLNTEHIYQQGSKFICRDTGKEAEKVEFYSHSSGKIGGWRYRYALVCGNNYWIVDAADSFGKMVYGPFEFGEAVVKTADYEVHEWGVIAGCNESEDWFLTSRPEQMLLVKQPVIYIHAEDLEEFDVKVVFNKGEPTQTYPLVEVSNNTLEWKNVKVAEKMESEAPKAASKARIPKEYVPLGEIIPILNDIDADELNYNNVNTRFLFYEGKLPFENKIEVSYDLEQKKVFVRNNSNYEVYDVIVAVGIGGFIHFKRYIAKIGTLAPGAQAEKTLEEAGRPDLKEKMIALGFTEKESEAFSKLWQKPFFAPTNLPFARLSYRLPRSEIERLIRLEFNPKPKKLLRELWVLVDLEGKGIGSGTGIVKTCSSDADCSWVSTNCCPENAGAHWECINAKLSKLDCTPKGNVCLQVISPKPGKACVCENGICTAESTKQSVSIKTDKEEYEQGEPINAKAEIAGDVYVMLPWSVQKLKNGEWETIIEPFIYLNKKNCEEIDFNAIKECPPLVMLERVPWHEAGQFTGDLMFIWDQYYIKELKSYKCIDTYFNREDERVCYYKTLAEPGKYKIRFAYVLDYNKENIFDPNAEIKYVEKEVTITEH
jgi:hypothetical protein